MFLRRPRSDEKLPDGFVRAGWRRVQQSGQVRFQGANRKSDRLLPYVGQFVFCEIVDMWGIDCLIYPEGWSYEEHIKHARCDPSSKVIVPENV